MKYVSLFLGNTIAHMTDTLDFLGQDNDGNPMRMPSGWMLSLALPNHEDSAVDDLRVEFFTDGHSYTRERLYWLYRWLRPCITDNVTQEKVKAFLHHIWKHPYFRPFDTRLTSTNDLTCLPNGSYIVRLSASQTCGLVISYKWIDKVHHALFSLPDIVNRRRCQLEIDDFIATLGIKAIQPLPYRIACY